MIFFIRFFSFLFDFPRDKPMPPRSRISAEAADALFAYRSIFCHYTAGFLRMQFFITIYQKITALFVNTRETEICHPWLAF